MNLPAERPQPRTGFEWSMYADATLAGLSILIPIPFLDDASETFFRRRMTKSIARGRGVVLADDVRAVISQGTGSWLMGCLMLPLKLIFSLIKKLSRKLLYFLTVKDSSEKLSYYWHRAFLLDYMVAAGHLETRESAATARLAMEKVLSTTASPLTQMARQVIGRSRHVWQTVRRARGGQEDEVIQETKSEMASRWGEFREYLEGLAARYDQEYRARLG